MRIAIGTARLALAALILAAIGFTYAETAARTGHLPNPFNFFGYFTIQGNLIGVVALSVSAAVLVRGGLRAPSPPGLRWLPAFRAAAVTYLVVVGLVYAVLLAPLGLEGGVPVPWANLVLHVASPIAIVLDWALVADRPAVPWRRLWPILGFPVLWLVVVLIRGASDGWVPYPFLAPANGPVAIALICLGIALAFVVAGAAVIALSRTRILAPGTMVVRRSAAARQRGAQQHGEEGMVA